MKKILYLIIFIILIVVFIFNRKILNSISHEELFQSKKNMKESYYIVKKNYDSHPPNLVKFNIEKNKIIGNEFNNSFFMMGDGPFRINFYNLNKLPLLNPHLIYKVWNSNTLFPILVNNQYDFSYYSKLSIMDLKADYFLKIENKYIYEDIPPQKIIKYQEFKNYELTKFFSYQKIKKLKFIIESNDKKEYSLDFNIHPNLKHYLKIVILTNKKGRNDVLFYLESYPIYLNYKFNFKNIIVKDILLNLQTITFQVRKLKDDINLEDYFKNQNHTLISEDIKYYDSLILKNNNSRLFNLTKKIYISSSKLEQKTRTKYLNSLSRFNVDYLTPQENPNFLPTFHFRHFTDEFDIRNSRKSIKNFLLKDDFSESFLTKLIVNISSSYYQSIKTNKDKKLSEDRSFFSFFNEKSVFHPDTYFDFQASEHPIYFNYWLFNKIYEDPSKFDFAKKILLFLEFYNLYTDNEDNMITQEYTEDTINTFMSIIDEKYPRYTLSKHKSLVSDIEKHLAKEFRPSIDFKEIKFMNSVPEIQYLVIIYFSTDIIQNKLFLIYQNREVLELESKSVITQEQLKNQIKSIFKLASDTNISIIDIEFKKIKLETEAENIITVFHRYKSFFNDDMKGVNKIIDGPEMENETEMEDLCTEYESSNKVNCKVYKKKYETNFRDDLLSINTIKPFKQEETITQNLSNDIFNQFDPLKSNIQVYYTFYDLENGEDLDKCSLFLIKHDIIDEEKIFYFKLEDILPYPNLNMMNPYTYNIKKTDWAGLEICKFNPHQPITDYFENPTNKSFPAKFIGASGYQGDIQNCDKLLDTTQKIKIMSQNNLVNQMATLINFKISNYDEYIKYSLLDENKDFSFNFKFDFDEDDDVDYRFGKITINDKFVIEIGMLRGRKTSKNKFIILEYDEEKIYLEIDSENKEGIHFDFNIIFDSDKETLTFSSKDGNIKNINLRELLQNKIKSIHLFYFAKRRIYNFQITDNNQKNPKQCINLEEFSNFKDTKPETKNVNLTSDSVKSSNSCSANDLSFQEKVFQRLENWVKVEKQDRKYQYKQINEESIKLNELAQMNQDYFANGE